MISFLHVSIHVHHVCAWYISRSEGGTLELELQVILNHCLGVVNQTLVLFKNECS